MVRSITLVEVRMRLPVMLLCPGQPPAAKISEGGTYGRTLDSGYWSPTGTPEDFEGVDF